MSKRRGYLLVAYEKGYRVDRHGRVVGLDGKLKALSTYGVGKYLQFSIHVDGIKRGVFVHRLQAYQKFGSSMFEDGIEVRHYDGNSFNNSESNILIGTRKDNHADRMRHTPKYKNDLIKTLRKNSMKSSVAYLDLGYRFMHTPSFMSSRFASDYVRPLDPIHTCLYKRGKKVKLPIARKLKYDVAAIKEYAKTHSVKKTMKHFGGKSLGHFDRLIKAKTLYGKSV